MGDDLNAILATDQACDVLAAGGRPADCDPVTQALAALVGDVRAPALPVLQYRLRSGAFKPRTASRRAKTAAVVMVGTLATSSGLAAAVTGDPLVPVRFVVTHLLGGGDQQKDIGGTMDRSDGGYVGIGSEPQFVPGGSGSGNVPGPGVGPGGPQGVGPVPTSPADDDSERVQPSDTPEQRDTTPSEARPAATNRPVDEATSTEPDEPGTPAPTPDDDSDQSGNGGPHPVNEPSTGESGGPEPHPIPGETGQGGPVEDPEQGGPSDGGDPPPPDDDTGPGEPTVPTTDVPTTDVPTHTPHTAPVPSPTGGTDTPSDPSTTPTSIPPSPTGGTETPTDPTSTPTTTPTGETETSTEPTGTTESETTTDDDTDTSTVDGEDAGTS